MTTRPGHLDPGQHAGGAEIIEPRETRRLVLSRPRLADVPALFDFLGDPAAMRHTQCDKNLSACRRRIAAHERQRRIDGYAPWVVREKGRMKPIGWGGLYDDPFDPGWGIELAFFFHPSTWGKGYGTELAAAALEVADHELRVRDVSAFAHPDNGASKALLAKVGFAQQRYVAEMDRILYSRRRRT